VKAAEDVNITSLPNRLYLKGELSLNLEVQNAFVTFIDTKIRNVLEGVEIDE
jgi:hypothetical protein